MNEIKELLESWKNEGLVNPDALEKEYNSIMLLVAKVEELEQKIIDLENK